jgi:hypothetical protein
VGPGDVEQQAGGHGVMLTLSGSGPACRHCGGHH